MSAVLSTQLYGRRHLLSRQWFSTPGTTTITAPAKAAYVRISMVGAGGWGGSATAPGGVSSGEFGGGAAFARKKTTCAPGDQFDIQAGDIAHTSGSGTAAGDSICTTNPGGTVLCKAQRGNSTAGGLASGSVGDTKRDGSAPPNSGGTAFSAGGASAGDDADTFPLGFGGRGSQEYLAAAAGGGGVAGLTVYHNIHVFPTDYALQKDFPPGNGRVCVEFFDQDPSIGWPGY